MKKVLLLLPFLFLLACSTLSAQNVFSSTDAVVTYNNNPTPPANTMAKWYRTSRMSWNTDKFKCYIFNGMAFRLRFPNGYNPADLTTKYPIIIFFHGGGEIAPISDNEISCYGVLSNSNKR